MRRACHGAPTPPLSDYSWPNEHGRHIGTLQPKRPARPRARTHVYCVGRAPSRGRGGRRRRRPRPGARPAAAARRSPAPGPRSGWSCARRHRSPPQAPALHPTRHAMRSHPELAHTRQPPPPPPCAVWLAAAMGVAAWSPHRAQRFCDSPIQKSATVLTVETSESSRCVRAKSPPLSLRKRSLDAPAASIAIAQDEEHRVTISSQTCRCSRRGRSVTARNITTPAAHPPPTPRVRTTAAARGGCSW